MAATTANALCPYFSKCVQGFHRFNRRPIKEAVWEDLHAQILQASGHEVYTQSDGSHQPGADIRSSAGDFSNKTAQYDRGSRSLKISSYRLTNVCHSGNPGELAAILAEIQRRKNFSHYSLLVRRQSENLNYDWYVLPADFAPLDPATYEWTPRYNRKKEVVGWKTNTVAGSSMSITFSMSSQLWLNVAVDEAFKAYLVGSCEVQMGRAYNYIELYDMFDAVMKLGTGAEAAASPSSSGCVPAPAPATNRDSASAT